MKTVEIPGSKSYTNRALVMAALVKKPVTIINALASDDTEAMIDCLKKVGITIQKKGRDLQVIGSIYDIRDGRYDLNARLSGTTIRFILALACIVPGEKKIYGHEGLNKRPIGVLVDGLRQLGADIEYTDEEGYPPVLVRSQSLTSRITTLEGAVSSQYFSALLMIAPVIEGLTIEVLGNQISRSYIDMTIDMMDKWGVQVENDNYKKYIVRSGQKYTKDEYCVEGDYSAAGYFFAIAALTQSSIILNNLDPDSKQGDRQFIEILKHMGNTIEYQKDAVVIHGSGVTPIEVNMEQCPDQAQTLAVLAAFAQGMTTMSGVRSLRVKETERVQALQKELAKMNIKTESPDADALIVYGGHPQAATIDTYGDHRMAMSFAIAAAKLPEIKIKNPEVVNKTFPEFWNTLLQIGIKTSYVQ